MTPFMLHTILKQSQNVIKSSFQGAVGHAVWWAGIVLAAGLIATTLVAHNTQSKADVATKRNFDFACNEIRSKILDRLDAHEQILRSGAAFFESSKSVSREEWRHFNQRQKVDQKLPGIQGIGFALLISRQSLAQHVQEIRAEGFPQYQVRPNGERESYSSIIYLEPFTNRNLRAFGYDMLSEPVRKAAMERARDQDAAVLSGKVVLVQETDKDVQAGALMYVPVYRMGMPHDTIAQRRDTLIGWVYSPYRMDDLMQGVLGGWNLASEKQMRLEVFDSDTASSKTLLHDSQPGEAQRSGAVKVGANFASQESGMEPADRRTASQRGKSKMDWGHSSQLTQQSSVISHGHQWTLRFTRTGSQLSRANFGKVLLVLFGGASSSLLLAGLLFYVLNTRFKALRLAEELAAELREGEALQHALLDNLPTAVVIVDPVTRVIERVNNHVLTLFGGSRDSLAGQPCHSLLVCANRSAEACSACDVEHSEKEMRQADGSSRPVLQTVKRIQLHGREKLLTCFVDLSERKQMEELLRQTNNRLLLAARAGGVGIWDYDVVNNQVHWDAQILCLYGITSAQFVGAYQEWLGWIHPEDRQQGDKEIQLALRGEREFDTEFRVLWRDGTTHYIRGIASVERNGTGQPLRMIGTNWDITPQKQLEETLRLASKSADSANEAKSQFLSNMSHEIRTPMNGVLGMVSLLLDTNLAEDQRRYARIAHASGKTLLALINDILDFSKIEAGKLELESLDFSLHNLLDDLAGMMAVRAYDKGLVLGCVMEPEVPCELQGDSARLLQILINLAANAIKFTAQGEVVIRVSVVSESPDEVRLRFAVRDTGIGIASEAIGRLFGKFMQVDSSTTRTYGGTGLGLAISKQLTELMGGEIGVESEAGKGSEFWFTVNLAKQPSKPANTSSSAHLRGARVLIVDDHPVNREILLVLLKSWGMRPAEAADGLSALHLLALAQAMRDPFVIAVIDSQMPGMDGASLGRAIKTDARLAAIRLVMCTSLGKVGSEQPLEKTDFDAALTKPVQRQELLEILTTIVSGQKTASSRVNSTEGPVQRKRSIDARILVADDNRTNQQVVEGILKKLGGTVEVVANGAEAVKALETSSFDLVLMDVQMPLMNGLDATRAIRHPQSRALNRQVPIIALTAHALQSDRDECMKAGMDDHLTKPIEVPALIAMLEKWLKPKGEVDLPMMATR